MLESLGENFTTLNTFLVVHFLISEYLDAELIPLFFMLTGASARYRSTSPLHCGLLATSSKEVVQAGGVCIGGSAFNYFSKLCHRICLGALLQPFISSGTMYYLLEVQRTLQCLFTSHSQGFPPVSETSPPSIYFQNRYQRRKGR